MNVKYDKKYCKMLIAHMEKGKSLDSFGGVIGVHRATIYRWKNKHKEFAEAYEIGWCKSLNKWEDIGIAGLYMGGKDNPFNSTVWIFNMKNRFGWKDKAEVEQQVNDNTITLNYTIKKEDKKEG